MFRPSFTLLCFGKLKTPGLSETANHYRHLLQSWMQLEEHELKPYSPSEAPNREAIQEQEERRVLAFLEKRKQASFFLLDETGKSLSTQGWRQFFEDHRTTPLCFVIGSSRGFSASLKQQARHLFQLGPQTLSHELARIVFLEQLYRAWSILKGHPYHQEGA